MNNITIYFLQLNAALIIFYVLYKLAFRRDSNFELRRFFLLYAIIISAIIPFLNISIAENSVFSPVGIIQLEELMVKPQQLADSVKQPTVSIQFTILLIYLIVTLFFLIRFATSIIYILNEALKSKRIIQDGNVIYSNKKLHASSFFKIVFIDPEKAEHKDMHHILDHEKQHAILFHSFDRILIELLTAICWINPIIWTLRKEIIVNHEYQADNKTVEQGTDQVSYQLTILNQYIGSASITNQFSTHIKNRIVMLNKNYKKGSFWKSISLIPVSMVLLFFIACGNEAEIDEPSSDEKQMENIFYVVEDMPQWPGEDDFAMSLRKFIATNLKYPDAAKNHGAEGKILVTFMVTESGEVIIPDPEMLPPEKNQDGGLNGVVVVAYKTLSDDKQMPDEGDIKLLKEEGKRVVGLMPKLIPGKQNGAPVNVLFTLPITFKLE